MLARVFLCFVWLCCFFVWDGLFFVGCFVFWWLFVYEFVFALFSVDHFVFEEFTKGFKDFFACFTCSVGEFLKGEGFSFLS